VPFLTSGLDDAGLEDVGSVDARLDD